MAATAKKIDKKFVLSDSTVNCYGFRLLTSGYQLDAYAKNPIGFYMHDRAGGVLLRWEDIQVEGDQVLGTPVINMSHPRGQQTCDEIEAGFLAAASVGEIVVLEYSTDTADMLPGQTGPTITRWTHKECSLVDIPGNSNALCKLFDAQDNVINLADFSNKLNFSMKQVMLTITPELLQVLNLSAFGTATVTEAQIMAGINTLAARGNGNNNELVQQHLKLVGEHNTLIQQVVNLKAENSRMQIDAILEKGTADKKLTKELRDKLALDYATNPSGLQSLVDSLPGYQPLTETLNAGPSKTGSMPELAWSWDEFEKNDPDGKKLNNLRAKHPERYKEIFTQKFYGNK